MTWNDTALDTATPSRMRQLMGAWLFVSMVALACLGIVFLVFGSLDFLIVRQCQLYGYWQTGQTRVLCEVDRGQVRRGGLLL